MYISLKKIDWIRLVIYLITVLFLAYFIFICFFAKPDQFLFGNVFIKTSPIDFGGFGSLLAGIFAPLAFLWLVLNFRQQDKSIKIAEEQLMILINEQEKKVRSLKAVTNITKKQASHFLPEHNMKLFNLTLQPKSDLRDCYIKKIRPDSDFKISRVQGAGIEGNPISYKFVEANNEIEITLSIDVSKFVDDVTKEAMIHINYVDIEGNNQTNIILFIAMYIKETQDYVCVAYNV